MEEDMVAAVMRKPSCEGSARPEGPGQQVNNFERRAYEILTQHCHFHGRAGSFKFAQCDDVLTVRGCVPSFYLKQVLQSVLRDVEGVRWIDNQVDVVASDGLSSVRS
jgi:hypothetical protein